jgi:RNA polymerase sigma-70 factor (ECF subfamily)
MDPVTPDSTETEGLLRQIRAGDRRAFDLLFARYWRYLHQVIEQRLDPKIRRRVDPSDIVQETQLEAFQRLADYLERQPMSFRAWLRKTAHERLLKIRRYHRATDKRSVEREVPLPDGSSLQLAQQLLAPGSTPCQHLDRTEQARRVRESVAQLSETDQEVVLMRNFEGLSNQEIGYVLDLDPAAVSKRHGRALLRLRELLLAGGFPEV